jgi:hypothetical protein
MDAFIRRDFSVIDETMRPDVTIFYYVVNSRLKEPTSKRLVPSASLMPAGLDPSALSRMSRRLDD